MSRVFCKKMMKDKEDKVLFKEIKTYAYTWEQGFVIIQDEKFITRYFAFNGKDGECFHEHFDFI